MEKFFDLYLSPAAAGIDVDRILTEDKLLRLHPHWFVDETRQEKQGLFATIRDYDTEQQTSFGLNLSSESNADDPPETATIMRITLFEYGVVELLFFADGEKTQVRVRFADGEGDEALEQDMLLWVRAIQEYLRLYLAATPRTMFFRLLMNRMVLQMNPSQRKICLMLTKITVVELFVILVIVIGYVSFGQ